MIAIFHFSFFILLIGCGGGKSLVKLDASDQFQLAMEAFDRGKYQNAIDGFKRVLFEHPGSHYVDDAQYYLAESYALMEDYAQGALEYQYLIRNFPESPYVEEAQYRLGVTYYRQSLPYYLDQADTHKAIQSFKDFLAKYPDSKYVPDVENFLFLAQEKLAKKNMENGRLYRKRKQCSSAVIYLQSLLEEYPKSRFRREATYLLGECYGMMGRKEEALKAYRELLKGVDGFVLKAREKIEKLEREE
ncbi:outer membrane protein assembly factor BamD [candidate division TA06 bacterium]|nr:outer membrane protein assembly factor BamD [candidate division TA06 bacterium]